MLPDHFKGMPPASNYCLLEVTFHFEECMESYEEGESTWTAIAMLVKSEI